MHGQVTPWLVGADSWQLPSKCMAPQPNSAWVKKCRRCTSCFAGDCLCSECCPCTTASTAASLPAMRSAHAMCAVQEFGLEDDAQKFAAEMQRAERMAAAAAAATAVGSIPGAAPSPARSRITAPSQRPSTGATLAALAGPGLASPFCQQAMQQQQLHAAARGLSGGLPAASALPSTRRASGALDLQITGGRPPTAAHPIDGP